MADDNDAPKGEAGAANYQPPVQTTPGALSPNSSLDDILNASNAPIEAPTAQPVFNQPGQPLQLGAQQAGGEAAKQGEPTPATMPGKPAAPETPPVTPGWLKPSPEIPMPPPHQFPAVESYIPPAPTPPPTPPTPIKPTQPPQLSKAPTGPGWGGDIGMFMQGVPKGVVKTAADAAAIAGYITTGRLSTNLQDQHGNPLEQASAWLQNAAQDTPQQAQSMPYQVGAALGSGVTMAGTAIGAGALGTAAATGAGALAEAGTLGTGAAAAADYLGGLAGAVGAGIKASKPIAAALGAAGTAIEGAGFYAAQQARIEKTTKNPSKGNVAKAAGEGAAWSLAFLVAGNAAQAGFKGLLTRFRIGNLVKSPGFVNASPEQRRFMLMQGMTKAQSDAYLLDEELQHIKNAETIAQHKHLEAELAYHEPLTPLAEKQEELAQKLALQAVREAQTPEEKAIAQAAARKVIRGRNNKQIDAMAAALPDEPLIQLHVQEDVEGPTRKPLGFNERGAMIGFNRIGGKPLEQLMAELPATLAGQVKEAFQAIGDAKANVLHLENAVTEYAHNAIEHITSGREAQKIEIKVIRELHHDKQMEVAKLKDHLIHAQGEEKKVLLAHIEAELKKPITKNGIRTKLLIKLAEMQGALDDIGKAIFNIPATKHVYAIADGTTLSGYATELADTFYEAHKQFAEAYRMLKNAEVAYNNVRKANQHVFEDIDAHLGKPTVITGEIEASKHATKQLQGKAVMAVGLQHDSSVAILSGRAKLVVQAFEAQLMAMEQNVRVSHLFQVAKKYHIAVPDALRALKKDGFIDPHVKTILAIGSGTLAALNIPQPAQANGLFPTPEEMNDEQRRAYYGGTMIATGLGLAGCIGIAVGAAMLKGQFGGKAGRTLIRTAMPLMHALYGWIERDVADIDSILGRTAAEDSLSYSTKMLRSAKNQLGLVSKNSQELLLRKMASDKYLEQLKKEFKNDPSGFKKAKFRLQLEGRVLYSRLEATITPEGHAQIDEVKQLEKKVADMLPGYIEDWNKWLNKLSDVKRLSQTQRTASLHSVNDRLGHIKPGNHQNVMNGILTDLIANKMEAQYTGSISLAMAIAQDISGFGGIEVGPKLAWKAILMYISDKSIADLFGKISFQGARSEAYIDAAQNSGTAAAFKQLSKDYPALRKFIPHHHEPTAAELADKHGVMEQKHGEVVYLMSIIHQYFTRSEELKHLPPQYRPTDVKDWIRRVMGEKPLLKDLRDDVHIKAGSFTAEIAHADSIHINRTGPFRGNPARAANIPLFNTYISIDARLIKLSVQRIATALASGQYQLAGVYAVRLAHLYAVKAVIGGGKAVIAPSLMDFLITWPATSYAVGLGIQALNNASPVMHIVGDLHGMVSVDPAFGPISGTVGLATTSLYDTINGSLDLIGNVGAMQDVLANQGGAPIFVGSKKDKTIKKAQKVIHDAISVAELFGFAKLSRFPGLANVPLASFVPARAIQSVLDKLPDLMNDEHTGGVPGLEIVPSTNINMKEPTSTKRYTNEETSLSKAITQATGLSKSQRDNIVQGLTRIKPLSQAQYEIAVQANSPELKARSGLSK